MPRWSRHRLPLRVGGYFFIAIGVFIGPGLLLAERLLRRELERSRIAALTTGMESILSGMRVRLRAAEARTLRLADLLTAEPQGVDPALVATFDRLVGRDRDGAWRSRRERFDG